MVQEVPGTGTWGRMGARENKIVGRQLEDMDCGNVVLKHGQENLGPCHARMLCISRNCNRREECEVSYLMCRLQARFARMI